MAGTLRSAMGTYTYLHPNMTGPRNALSRVVANGYRIPPGKPAAMWQTKQEHRVNLINTDQTCSVCVWRYWHLCVASHAQCTVLGALNLKSKTT